MMAHVCCRPADTPPVSVRALQVQGQVGGNLSALLLNHPSALQSHDAVVALTLTLTRYPIRGIPTPSHVRSPCKTAPQRSH